MSSGRFVAQLAELTDHGVRPIVATGDRRVVAALRNAVLRVLFAEAVEDEAAEVSAASAEDEGAQR